MRLLVALLVMFVVQTFAQPFDCTTLSSITPGACGYNWLGQSREDAGTEFLRSKFHIPTYTISTPRTHTYLCAHSRTHLPECLSAPARGTGDRANIRIPNVVNWQMPCHVVTDSQNVRWPVWAWDAIEIPPVSNFQSYLDLVFTKDGTVRDGTRNWWGFGLDQLYITKVTYTDNLWKDEQNYTSLYAGELFFTDNTRYNREAWNEYDLPNVCNPSYPGASIIYDFFKTCAHTWVEHPSTALWNTQTQDSSCFCSAFDSSGVAYLPRKEYFWWYGTCNKCDYGKNDIHEQYNANIPSDNFDEDVDGVPNNCDLCPGFSDKLDADLDRVPDTCDKCPGFPDYEDENSNSVPDACDLCARRGCGSQSTCVDGINSFTCTCSSGYMIKGTAYNKDNVAKSFVAGVPTFKNWAAQKSNIVSSSLASSELSSATSVGEWLVSGAKIPIEFVLKHNLADFAVVSLFDEFFAAVQKQFGICADCGLFTVSYTWEHVRTDSNGDLVTSFVLNFIPYATQATYAPNGGGTGTCVMLDMCALYGCGANAVCTNSVVPNQRTCTCATGFIGDAFLIGNRRHADCQAPVDVLDECATYGCKTLTPGALPGVCSPVTATSRMCSCETGYSGTATLEGSAPFLGCVLIDWCAPKPCSQNSVCSNSPTAPVCECMTGYVNVGTADVINCVDPCFLNNGGCQDICISPMGDSPKSCSCSGENAMVSLLNDRACVCKEGYFGNGKECSEKEECLVNTVWGGNDNFFSTPTVQSRTPFSPVCLGYSDLTCCALGRPVFNPQHLTQWTGNNKCIELLEETYCSVCEPTQKQFSFKGNTFVMSLCADYCQIIFQHCSTVHNVDDEADPPTYITNGYSDPVRWCEEVLPSFLPFESRLEGVEIFIDAHGFDKSQCFSPASSLSPSFFVLALGFIGLFFSLGGVY